MLECLRIRNFKTLLHAEFPLASLNVLSGLNGMGKSSLIQTLLLLRQSNEATALERGLLLQGNYLNLGVGQDILAAQAETNEIQFDLYWDDNSHESFHFGYEQNSDFQPRQRFGTQDPLPDQSTVDPRHIKYAKLSTQGWVIPTNPGHPFKESAFQYLSADRITPESSYKLSAFHLYQGHNPLGHRGEYAVQFIAEKGSSPLPITALQHSKAAAPTFLANLNAWMSEIAPGIRIKASAQPQSNSVTLHYAFEYASTHGKDITADFKPQNVGFGLTYVLPIVTALLCADPGDLLIFENPESHLHPAGQSTIAQLCALAATNGVQLQNLPSKHEGNRITNEVK